MTSIDHGFGANNLVRNKAIGNSRANPLPPLLAQLLERAGQPAIVERAVSRPWASALFEGQRHMVRLRLSGDDFPERGSAFMASLAEVEWALPGHFVADISVDDGDADMESVWLELSALTIEEW